MVWKPRVTVAAVCEQDGRFLMVEEKVQGETRFNQPAGHLEDGESLVEAAVRECREETAREFEPLALTGIYRWRQPGKRDTYLRATFYGKCSEPLPGRTLDAEIVATHWMTLDEVETRTPQLRSPLVLQSLRDFLSGRRYPLELLVDLE